MKAILSTSGWVDRYAPAFLPYPLSMFTTPSGIPASFTSSAIFSDDRGVCSAGFMTTVHPAARA